MENVQKEIYSETFTDLVNKKTGKDYSWFFKQYLYKREAPFLEFCWTNDKLYYRWKNTSDDFVLPIKIKVSDKTITLYPTTKLQTIDLSNTYSNFYDNSDELYFGTEKNKKLPAEFNRSQ